MSFRKFPAVMAAALVPVAAAALVLVPARPAAAQEEVQDEGAAYRAWHAANQANQTAQAIEAATAYLKQYPTGQYADFIKKWLGQARMAVLDATIKEKRTADMVKMGRQILAGDPENLNILYALAFNIRRNELLASPASYENSAAAVEFSSKAIALIEAGKTLAGVQSFDKNATLAWLTQILAMNEAKGGKAAEAIRLYEKSTSLAPQDPGIASRNLYAVYALRLSFYGEAVKAYNALPEADKTAGEPKPEVKAARDKVNAEADTLIDSAAAFVAFAKVKNLPPAARDKVNQTLEAVYKSRHPEDAGLAGLQKVLQEKEQVLGAAPAPGA